jgi:hypothetical protein
LNLTVEKFCINQVRGSFRKTRGIKIMFTNSTNQKIRSASFSVIVLVLFLLCVSVFTTPAQQRTEIAGPAGSTAFGSKITFLPNGNFVVVDPEFNLGTSLTVNVGAVFLYSPTGTLISQITGTTGNSFVGSGGITILSNGDFVISSPRWTRPAALPQNNEIVGAVTKCSGVTGCSGQITESNSLTGNINGDNVGIGGIIALPNGDYLVRSPNWGVAGFPNNSPNLGALTHCKVSTNSCTGQRVTAANSLVGSIQDGSIGNVPVTVLSGGDYVISNPGFKKSGLPAGAVMICSGETGCPSNFSQANSLTGSVYSDLSTGDGVGGSGVYALPNNLYLVATSSWIKPGATPVIGAGAVTLCNASTNSCAGQLATAANSLTGSTFNDFVGNQIFVLPNGDYVVNTRFWTNPAGNSNSGAVTLCRSSSNSCGGQQVSSANSLTGFSVGDNGSHPITILTNGNYVVSSPGWRPNTSIQSAGAATFCNTVTNSCAGQVVSAANSLIGSSFGDSVSAAYGSSRGVTALTNGNYVVSSPNWRNPAIPQGSNVGAVTLCSGTTGCAGAVTTANSLIGSAPVDQIGERGATALANGNYVVNSPNWTAGSSQNGFGAATLCNGTANNCAGQTVSAANSLTGSKITDRVGLSESVALTNGNYVVVSSEWDLTSEVINVGAATFCNAANNSCAGQQVSASNSLIGSTAEDRIGTLNEITIFVKALPNGNYILVSPLWDNGFTTDVGAITIGSGTSGVSGAISAANSIVGTTAGNGTSNNQILINYAADASGNKVIVGLPKDNKVVIVRFVRNVRFDFDGDGKADVSVYRPSNGGWYLLNSTAGFSATAFGISTDRIAPADYDGDGKTDLAVYRDGTWYLQRSSLGFTGVGFGIASDTPVPADFDGDGKSELAVFRPSNGGWYIYNLATNQASSYAFGTAGDIPVPADYDGDGKADIAVFRSGTWYIQRSQLGFTGVGFGQIGDKPVPADYDGDGKNDLAVYRPSTGAWYLLQSTAGFSGVSFGISTDLPAPADYDGDGRADIAVFRDGTWYLQRSQLGFTGIGFGVAGDKPIPNAFVP